MKSFINTQAIRQFITLLVGKVSIPSYLVLFTLGDKKSEYFNIKDIDAIVDYCEKKAKKEDVYFNLVFQDLEKAYELWKEELEKDGKFTEGMAYHGRGYKATTTGLVCLWFDLDIKDDSHAHAENKLPENLDQAMEFVRSLPIQPTLIINSGHGLHLYMFLKNQLIFSSNEDRKKAENISKYFQQSIRDLGLKQGWKFDNTADIMRLFRVAGTVNYKDRSNPIPVTILELNEGNMYEPSDFEQFIPCEHLKNDEMSVANTDYTSTALIEYSQLPQVEPIEKRCRFAQYCIEHTGSLPEPHWYAWICLFVWCQNGAIYIHKISSVDSRYSQDETEKKIEQALNLTGAITCEHINQITNGEFCNGCQHCGKINSPISLGYSNEMTYKEAIEKVEDVILRIEDGDKTAHLGEDAIKVFSIIALHNFDEFIRLKERINALGGKIRDFTNMVKRETQKLEIKYKAEKANTGDEKTISVGLSKENFIIPPGYSVGSDGIFILQNSDGIERKNLIAHRAVLITGKQKDLEEKKELIELAWLGSRGWETFVVEREAICDSRKIISELSSKGFPVNSTNSNLMVKYLADFEACNEKRLSTSYVVKHLGWVGKGDNSGFLLGGQFINSRGEILNITEEDEDGESFMANQGVICFRGETVGEDQIVKGIQSQGSFESWKEIIQIIKDYPKALIIFYSSFVPPMLKLFKIDNFCVELANRTSTGKTTILRVAAANWGNPDERQPYTLINSWDATTTWIERAAAILNSLPFLVDDTKRARRIEDVGKIIYELTSGRGRNRGNRTGTASTKSWRTVLISTGESPSILFSHQQGGVKARILEITGKPFGNTNEQTKKVVGTLNSELKENYGFSGPIFVKFVIEHKGEWEQWKKEFKEIEKTYSSKVTDSVAGRLCEPLAAIKFTSIQVNRALGLEWDFNFDSAILGMIDGIIDESKDASGEEAALEYVMSWAYSHEQTFEGRSEYGAKQPYCGWSGRWDEGEFWDNIAFYPSVLKKVLEESGYDYDAILRGWKELGYLDVKKKSSRKYMKQIRSLGTPRWMIPIKKSAVDSMYAEEEEPNVPNKIASYPF
jgi:putative DNA primase/helicase